MSDISNKNATNRNNELASPREDVISENPWVVGVSKTHPGLKYYFNKITGVSLWNISREDMVRAKQSVNGSQPQYINCPEPDEPPPSKRVIIKPMSKHCDHHHSKYCNKQLLNCGYARESLGHACDVMYSSTNTQPNVITVNVQPYPNPSCMSRLENICGTIPQSQIHSSLAVQDNLTIERNNFNINHNSVLGSKKFLNTNFSEIVVQGSSNEHLHNQSCPDSEFFDDTSQFETIDVTPLKRFSHGSLIKDKWYIVADANVYLHHITFLKSIMYSDEQCCLMVPQNVKPELDSESKRQNRIKAYYALYYIYKMYDRGFAHIDGDNSEHIENKSNEKHILDCCSKLKDQNYYVVVISNDLELQKYRKKMYLPIFTVAQLKEYLYKCDNSVTTESSEHTLNFSQTGKKDKVPNNQSMSHNRVNVNTSTMTDTYETVKQDQNVQTSPVHNITGMQTNFYDLPKRTTDAEVQTTFSLQSEDIIDTAYRDKSLPNQNNYAYKGNNVIDSNTQSCESSLRSGNRSSGIKLRRKNYAGPADPNLSSKFVNLSVGCTNTNNTSTISTANDNSSLSKILEEHCNIPNINDNSKQKEITESTQEHTETNKNSTIERIHNLSRNINTKVTLKVNQSTILESNAQNKNIESNYVMFEVSSAVMEQNLSSKIDEWLSRFIQIMEEALTQVLRKNSLLYLPPPWSMYEATMCVGKMYKQDEDIADASKKFLNVLNTIHDDKGNINTNINPVQYMEMYSVGVYVIDALQGMFSTCEDLQAASESLTKLLSDIQDPEADISNIDSFHNTSQGENLVQQTEKSTDEGNTNNTPQEGNTVICTKTGTTSTITSPVSSSSYNQTTRRKRMSIENEEEPSSPPPRVFINESGKNTFLTNFHLQRKILQNTTNNISEQEVTKDLKNNNVCEDVRSLTRMKMNQGLNSNASDSSHNSKSSKPKIVRNFVMCSEFENRLRKRHIHNEIDFLHFNDGERAMGFMDTDENSGDTGRLHIDEYTEDNDNDDSAEQEINFTVDFKHFIKRIGQEIHELSTEVYSFSKNACESLSMSTLDDKNDIREKAIQMHLYINKLCIALTELLDRDKNGGYNLRAILRNTEFYDILVEDDEIITYGAFIAQCLELADALRSTVTDVLSVVCEV